MAHDVFISYSSKDKPAADAVCAALEQSGVRCWVAPRDVRPGDVWATAILKAIAASRMMVLVFSRHSQESPHIRREVERAVHHGLAIAPVRIDDVLPVDDFEYYLSSSHWMDAMTPPLDAHLARLCGQVRSLLDAGAKPAGGEVAWPAAKRRWGWAAVAAAGVVVACIGVGAWVAGRHSGSSPSGAPRGNFVTPANGFGMTLVEIKPGVFLMGSPAGDRFREDDEALHRVTLTKPFRMSNREVTRGQFAAFVAETRYATDAETEGLGFFWNGKEIEERPGASWRDPGFEQGDDHPVVNVSWNDAVAFANWLGGKDGRKYRLPTEAEWEYVCRAGSQSVYPWGDDADGGKGRANAADRTAKEKFPDWSTFGWSDGFVFTAPGGQFEPAWGVFDLIGNVAEWCSDWFDDYPPGDATDPTGPPGPVAPDKAYHVIRGGSWFNGPLECRVPYRRMDAPSYRNVTIGFRLCGDP